MSQILNVKNFRNVMNGHATAEICSLLNGEVVRRLKAIGDALEIDALTDTVTVNMDDNLTFMPWFMDRGNILFTHTDIPGNQGKLCTQFDIIKYPDGSEFEISMG